MNKTQEQKVKYQLETTGKVSRNWAIFHQPRYDGGITRLGAIICNLNKEGWCIEGRKTDTRWGKNDYLYEVKHQNSLGV